MRGGRGASGIGRVLCVALLAALALGACGSGQGTEASATAPVASTTSAAPASASVGTSVSSSAGTTASTLVASPPTSAQIAAVVGRAYETKTPSEHFVAKQPVTVPDGSGGSLTAVPALRDPSADGHGWVVFLWRDQRFVGVDTSKETWDVELAAAGGAIAATYPVYASSDPACCPSGKPVTIRYGWSASGLTRSASLPSGSLIDIAVTVRA